MRSKLTALLLALPLLAVEPQPLTDAQKVEALTAALATAQARAALLQLDLQYRTLRDQAEGSMKKAEGDEQAAVEKLRTAAGAAGCLLTAKAEWDCTPVSAK